jgi:protein phosphatase 1 regulatory subunit 14B
MEYSLPSSATTFTQNRSTAMPKPTSLKDGPPKSLMHVNFNTEKGELTDRKKKYLTAKYGQHQMNLIKKRLRVEMWMYEQLQSLYNISVSYTIISILLFLFFLIAYIRRICV